MKLFFTGKPDAKLAEPLVLPPPALDRHENVTSYEAPEGLRHAVQVSLLMGQPLLITGEPGSGKTQLAYSLAREFGLPIEPTVVRSTTTAQDLFYEFDELSRFRDIQNKTPRPLISYLTFTGLGLAILMAGGPAAELTLLPGNIFEAQADQRPKTFGDLFLGKFPVAEPSRSVVLIDELDKAPRDTPNDMLSWIERMYFEIKEMGVRVDVPLNSGSSESAQTRPIVVITSNSEKSLPDPFLRRCVYFDIPFPDQTVLERIVAARLTDAVAKGPLGREALAVFQQLRSPGSGIRKPPATAEFVAWLVLLNQRYHLGAETKISDNKDILEQSLGALVKTREDTAAARQVLAEWLP